MASEGTTLGPGRKADAIASDARLVEIAQTDSNGRHWAQIDW